MENESIKDVNDVTENSENKTDKIKRKFNLKIIFISLCLFIGFVYLIYVYVISIPLKAENLYCNYSGKFNKITCTQTGDVVPEWLQVDDNQFLKYLGIGSEYTMKLIISHDKKDYKVMNMTDKEFISGMNRKFIYELKEQTFNDWIDFKKYALKASTSNWGSIVLYCSEDNLKEDICKQMKKQYKK